MSDRSYMPEMPCNNGCPRSPDGSVKKLFGAAWRAMTAQPHGCGYVEECGARRAVSGLGDYRGDATHLIERFGALPLRPPDPFTEYPYGPYTPPPYPGELPPDGQKQGANN